MRRGLIGRGLALLAAALIFVCVVPRTWWSYQTVDPVFHDAMHGTVGVHLADWCTGVFCHQEHMARSSFHLGANGTFFAVGRLLHYLGLGAALLLALAALAERRHTAVMARAALLGALATGALALAAFLSHTTPPRADYQLGLGFPAGLVGAALGTLGALLMVRDPVGLALPRWPTVATVLCLLGAGLMLTPLLGHRWWHWHWSDEENAVGLRGATRCWDRPGWNGRQICSEMSVPEAFLGERDDQSGFDDLRDRTYYAGLAGFVLLLGGVMARVVPGAPDLLRAAHGPALLVLLLACATVASVPHMGRARIAALGWGFPILVLGCLAAIAGSLLVRPRDPVADVPATAVR